MSGGSRSGRLASAVLVAAALPFAAVLLLALREAHGGLTADQVVVYYLLPAAWLGATAFAFSLPRETRLNLALAIVSLTITLGVAEVTVGWWLQTQAAPQGPPPGASEVRRLRSEGHDAFPRVPGNSLVDLNPTLRDGERAWHPITPGPGHSMILLCKENGPLVSYRSDRFGFDNRDEVWDGVPPDVAVIGDSYTVGVCVSDGESIPKRLGTRFRVLNVGVSGAGPLQELAILREYVAPLAPPVVVWIYYEGNDAWDLDRESKHDWLLAYLEPDHTQGLRVARSTVDLGYRAWIDSIVASQSATGSEAVVESQWDVWSAAPRLRSLRRVAGFGVLAPARGSRLGRLPEVLSRARDDVGAWGGRLVLVYMPAYERYATRVGEAIDGRRELLAFARENGIEVVDLHRTFAARDDPRSLWMSSRGHLTPEGYALAAHVIGLALE